MPILPNWTNKLVLICVKPDSVTTTNKVWNSVGMGKYLIVSTMWYDILGGSHNRRYVTVKPLWLARNLTLVVWVFRENMANTSYLLQYMKWGKYIQVWLWFNTRYTKNLTYKKLEDVPVIERHVLWVSEDFY